MKYRFLIANDDGYRSKGINFLAGLLQEFGEVVVVAPDGARSGFSNSITLTQPLRLKLRKQEGNLTIYSVVGTPADCVKLAIATLFKDEAPTLILSGINHGGNEGVSVHYSGTLGAAREGAFLGIPALGISILEEKDPDFTKSKDIVLQVIRYMLANLDKKLFLSLNIPKGEVKGLKLVPQAMGRFVKEFVEGKDGHDNTVYWMTGHQEVLPPKAGEHDVEVLSESYASLTPLTLDQTDYSSLEELNTSFD